MTTPATPNHALQRTAPRVTLAASSLRLSVAELGVVRQLCALPNMKTILIALAVVSFTCACAGESDWGTSVSLGYIGEQQYESTISKKLVLETADWTPQDPIPISTHEIVKTAMNQFDTIVPNRTGWEIESISLQCLKSTHGKKLYFVVTIAQKGSHRSSLSSYVSLGGKPGTIKARRKMTTPEVEASK